MGNSPLFIGKAGSCFTWPPLSSYASSLITKGAAHTFKGVSHSRKLSYLSFLGEFKLQKVWILVDLPKGHRAIGTKWVYRNKKDERGIVIRNKARLVAQGHTQEEGIDSDEVFAPVTRIEAIRMFLAYASYMGFMVYQMDTSRF
ncbi:putative ribonuclease H-like domain-containing protein [Tanacetum coccineum]